MSDDRTARRARRGRIVYRILTGMSAIMRRLPLRVVDFFGYVLGHLAWLLVRRERRRALDHLAASFPELSASECRGIARRMFHHLGMSLFEMLWLPNLDDPEVFARTTQWVGVERVLEEIDRGRGVVTFTAHCGNWEWLAYGVGKLGRPTSVLQRGRNEADINRFITELRERAGTHSIDRGSIGSAREMIQRIRSGGILAFLIDQNIRSESVKVPFFGRPALTPIGPAKLAVRTEALAVTVFAQRKGGVHVITWGEPFQVHRDDDPVELTARVTREIEAQIRRAPEQWVWMHERWKERPKYEVKGLRTED